MSTAAIEVKNLRKSYGLTVALAGIDLTIPQGMVYGLLGPNGAGKTTAVRILSTLLRPDAGEARVLGHDVLTQPDRVRRIIGLAGQFAAVDDLLSGRENLELVGKLYHLGRAEAKRRARDLLERFDLEGAADRLVKTYSGGMRRRLDLAASLMNRPTVLFLDEPTTGLDPRSRMGLWEIIRDLVNEGTTLLLTTQYLEEADRLSQRIAVIDEGTVIAEGTGDELKAKVGGSILELRVVDPSRLEEVAGIIREVTSAEPRVDRELARISAAAEGDGVGLVAQTARRLDEANVQLADLALRRPTLDEAFLKLTGRGHQ
ncbi:MAG: daunorubicin resistance protein DrrA family ABC transporter ATP-binding protein [Thermoleophilia bacterium]